MEEELGEGPEGEAARCEEDQPREDATRIDPFRYPGQDEAPDAQREGVQPQGGAREGVLVQAEQKAHRRRRLRADPEGEEEEEQQVEVRADVGDPHPVGEGRLQERHQQETQEEADHRSPPGGTPRARGGPDPRSPVMTRTSSMRPKSTLG